MKFIPKQMMRIHERRNMENYIQIIIMLAPGFIAKEISRLLGDIQTKSNALEEALGYFLYSIFTVIPTACMIAVFGYDIRNLPLGILEIVVYMIAIVISGCITGACWALYIKKYIQKLANWITVRKFGYMYVQEKTLIDSNLMDGEEHFIEVIRNGNRIALGKFEGITFKDDESYVIKVNSHPVYDEWLAEQQWEQYFQHKCMYIDATHNIEIIEYYFPKGFFSKTFDIKKATTSMETE